MCVPANISRLKTVRTNENTPRKMEMAATLTAHRNSRLHSLSSYVRDARLTTEKAVKAAQYWRFLLSVIVDQRNRKRIDVLCQARFDSHENFLWQNSNFV
jgi:hypothetical protein